LCELTENKKLPAESDLSGSFPGIILVAQRDSDILLVCGLEEEKSGRTLLVPERM
jgi:hypothetical protein